MTSLIPHPRIGATSTDLAWRVLALVNLYRLLVPLLLVVLYLVMSPSPVGHVCPALFGITAGVYFLFAVVSIWSVKSRWPEIALQTFISVCVDVVALSLLTYTSGGMNSGISIRR